MTTSPSFPAIRLAPVGEDARRALFTEARTANTFTDEPVTDEQLETIYDLAKYGPTSANINPLRILFLRPGEGRDRLLPLMNEGNRAKTATAPAVAVPSTVMGQRHPAGRDPSLPRDWTDDRTDRSGDVLRMTRAVG